MAFLELVLFFRASRIWGQIYHKLGAVFVKSHGMPINPNAIIFPGKWEPSREQADGVYSVPGNET